MNSSPMRFQSYPRLSSDKGSNGYGASLFGVLFFTSSRKSNVLKVRTVTGPEMRSAIDVIALRFIWRPLFSQKSNFELVAATESEDDTFPYFLWGLLKISVILFSLI